MNWAASYLVKQALQPAAPLGQQVGGAVAGHAPQQQPIQPASQAQPVSSLSQVKSAPLPNQVYNAYNLYALGKSLLKSPLKWGANALARGGVAGAGAGLAGGVGLTYAIPNIAWNLSGPGIGMRARNERVTAEGGKAIHTQGLMDSGSYDFSSHLQALLPKAVNKQLGYEGGL